MVGVTDVDRCMRFLRIAREFKRILKEMDYRGDEHILENRAFKTRFIIEYPENKCEPSAMKIKVMSEGVEAEIYSAQPEIAKGYRERTIEKVSALPAKGTERLFSEEGETVICEQCGCIDFVKKGEEWICSVCCHSITD